MDVFAKLNYEEQKELLKIVIDDLDEEEIVNPEKIKDLLVEKINEITSNKIVLCGKDGQPVNPDGKCCKNSQDSQGRYFNFYDDNEIIIDNKGYCWSKEDLENYSDSKHPYDDSSFDETYLEWSQEPIPLNTFSKKV